MAGVSNNRLSAEELAELVSGLSTEQLELLELLLKEQGVDLASTVILPRKRYAMPGGNGVYMPLSYSQQRMWFLDQFEPASPFYNIPTAVRMSGQVDVQILTDCLNEIIRRHEALRTTFTRIDGQPVQVIQPALVLSIPVIDLISSTKQTGESRINIDSAPDNQGESPNFSEALRLANQEARKPFDLASGPLVRVTLIRLSEKEHLFLLTMHHIISDGWSMGIFIQELTSLYGSYSTGKLSPLADLKVQYADFSVWQREWLSGEMMEGQLAYWINQLGGHLPALELPADFQRPAVLSSRGASYTSSLSKSLVDGLRNLSQHYGVTLFMTLLAAFNTLLYRYTGQTDLTIGSPIANRSRPELESLIGMFINTLALRTDLSGSPTFKDVLARVREVALGAYAHQDIPFELVVEKLQVERDLSHNPVFQVMLVLQNAPKQTIRLPGLTFESLEVHSNTSTFDLTLNLTEIPDGMHVSVEFATDLFTVDTIQRLLRNWQVLLQAVIVNPEQSIDTLPFITETEMKKILSEFNQGPLIPKPEGLLHQAILNRISDLESIAVTGRTVDENGRDLTYRELIRDSKHLAAYLQSLGVGSDSLVGICIPRSVEMIVGMLGILDAGGAYLPLDPKYPRPRLEYMLADSRAQVVLTLGELLDEEPGLLELFESSGAILVRMDTDWPTISQPGRPLDESLAAPDNLAYLIYTSGSTGQPKGVQICHRALANFVAWAKGAYHLTASDRVLQFATLNFDSAVEEIYPILVAGGTLVLRPELLMSFTDFHRWVGEQGITVLDLPTAYWHAWVSDLENSGKLIPACIRLVIVGGERAIAEQYEAWLRIGERGWMPEWINTYGPTEATVVCLAYSPPSNWREQVAPILPVGRPIGNTQVLVVDSHQQGCPVGVPGELWVAGEGLARGYLNQPDLTSERFVPPPEWLVASSNSLAVPARYYRTGDRVRFLPDGNLDFIGRFDDQIKLRGFRIELREIELALAEHPLVREVAVVLRSAKPVAEGGHHPQVEGSEKQLVAFVSQLPGSQELTTNELQSFARAKLPEYMLPTGFVVLPELPINPNGKVDRKALESPSKYPLEPFLSSTFESGYEAPRNPIESRMAELWVELLGASRVGIQDNFFDLGGHSLLATQLVSHIQEVFQVELPLRLLFEMPTIAGLAPEIERRQQPLATDEVGPIKAASSPGVEGAVLTIPRLPRDPETQLLLEPPVLSFAQQRLWFLDQFEPGTPNYNIPSAIRWNGPLALDVLEKCVNEIVRRHEVLRTSILTEDGRPVQEIQPALHVKIPVEDISALESTEREARARQLAEAEARQPFDLSQAPLFRVQLIRLAPEEHLMLLTFHHIISDGWSSGVMVREMAALYPLFLSGGKDSTGVLPRLDIQYADFAAWQRSWLQGAVLQQQLDYWRNQLADSPTLLELPTDRPRPAVQTINGDVISFDLSPERAALLNDLSRKAGATIFMTLLAAFNILLMRYTGQTDINVGTPIANRNRKQIENLVGFFVNTLVLRTNLSDQPSFLQVIDRVKQAALGAYAHQDIPFEMLVNELQPERDTSHTPLFQVMFVMQNIPITDMELPGVNLSSMDSSTGAAMFDLTLTMEEHPQGLSGGFEYNTDLFDSATIRRMINHFKTLLSNLVDHPDKPVEFLPMLTSGELDQIFVEWNQSQAFDLPGLAVHQLFEKQVERTPDALALVGLDGPAAEPVQLSYAQLNQRANQLAHYLVELGVGPEKLVGLCIERSPEMIIGLLAILKAGGAYVPLDPAYPKERLIYMLDDMRADMVVTMQRFSGVIPEDTPGLSIVEMDRLASELSAQPVFNPPARTGEKNLAYVIYTSGSTGRPKGVQVEHASLTNFVWWAKKAYQFGPDQRVLQFASLNFDTAVEEIYPTLATGGLLVLRPESILTSFEEFHRLVETYQLTILDLPTAYWHAWVSELNRTGSRVPDCVRLVIVGGEQALIESYKTWLKLTGGELEWINTYGPSEATVVCLSHTPEKDVDSLALLPIGRPIDNTYAYVVDRNLQVLPVGASGELVIGGAGLARGYLNLPENTRDRFVSPPREWAVQFGALAADQELLPDRLYRTGDRVRYLKDGSIDFLGRIDNQVKLRGMRVEPGEIETVLRQVPGVQDAIVLALRAQPDQASSLRLVAYLLVKGSPGEPGVPGEADVRNFLKDRLPAYMVPSTFAFLESYPLTPNGKVDRKALAALSLDRLGGADSEKQMVEPRTPQEAILVEIWKQVLGIERVSVSDNFFELGGDSILSIQVTARANQAGLHLNPRQLFEGQSIAELAALATAGQTIQAEQGLVTGPVALTPIQHWFFEQGFPNPSHFNQSLMFEVNQVLDPALLQKTIARLMEHHDALRLRFHLDGQSWSAENADLPNDIPVKVIDLSELDTAKQKEAIEAEAEKTQAGLDIDQGPMLWVVYFYLGTNKPGRLLIVIHHLIVDGVSWRILAEDLQAIYAQLANHPASEEPVQLPSKTTSFQYWANELQAYANSAEVASELEFWKSTAAQPFDHVFPDNPAGPNVESSTRAVRRSLTEEETRLLLQDVPAVYKTEINDLLMAALIQSYQAWLRRPAVAGSFWPEVSGETNLILLLEGHGREDILPGVDISRTIGWFTSLYPVHLAIKETDSPGEIIMQVKEQLRRTPRKGIGYGILRYLRQDSREVFRLYPEPQITFNYLGQVARSSASQTQEPEPGSGQVDEARAGARNPGGSESPILKGDGIAAELSGSPYDPDGPRPHLIEIDGGVMGGQLGLGWSYSENLFTEDTIATFADAYMASLRELIAHCLSPEAGGYTSSDFPLADIDQSTLDKVLTKISQPKRTPGR